MNAEAILSLRASLGWSQRDLALELGVSAGTVAHWERGAREPTGSAKKLLDMFAEELNLTGTAPVARTPLAPVPRSLRGLPSSVFWVVLRKAFNDEHRNPMLMRLRLAAVRNYAEHLGQLRALAVKIGQSHTYLDLTMTGSEAAVLRTLEKRTPPMPGLEAAAVLTRELGANVFAEWDPEPFATASIGQAHHAVGHDGRALVVKIQYPDVRAALDSDLQAVGVIERLVTSILMGQKPGTLVESLGAFVRRECDYVQEAAAQRKLARSFADRPDIVVPEIVSELCTDKVLTSVREGGQSFEVFSRADDVSRAHAAASIWRYYLVSALENGCFNTDPHPGNLAFRARQVVFYDYGRVQTLTPEFHRGWKALVRAILERDRARITATSDALGFISRPDKLDYDYGYRLLARFYLPFLQDRPFLFTREYIAATWHAFLSDNPNKRYVSFPPDMTFFLQLFFGSYALLAGLNAPVDCRTPVLDALYHPAEQRPAPYTDSELHLLGLT